MNIKIVRFCFSDDFNNKKIFNFEVKNRKEEKHFH